MPKREPNAAMSLNQSPRGRGGDLNRASTHHRPRLANQRNRAAVIRRLAVANRAAHDREAGCLRMGHCFRPGKLDARGEARAPTDRAAVSGAAVDQRHILQRERRLVV